VTTRLTARSVTTRTFVAVELSTSDRTFINHPLFAVRPITKRFVFAVLTWSFTGKHLGSTALRFILRNVITTIVPARSTIPAALARFPLTTRAAIITTTLPARSTIITTRRAIISPAITTRTTLASTITRLPLTTRTAIITTRSTLASTFTGLPLATRTTSSLTAGGALPSSLVVTLVWFFVRRHGYPTLRQQLRDCATSPPTL